MSVGTNRDFMNVFAALQPLTLKDVTHLTGAPFNLTNLRRMNIIHYTANPYGYSV